MTVTDPQPTTAPPRPDRASPRDVAVLVALAGTSGAAIVAHTWGWLELRWAAPFVVLPSAAALVGLVFLARREFLRAHVIADRVLAGGVWGFVATLFYDLVRPPVVALFNFSFNPWKAMPIFGSLITGQPETDTFAIVVGWGYHFWNGIGFGMMYALVRPRGGWVTGLAWGLGLQVIMMAIYPDFLQVRLDDPGFLWTGIIGHASWGAVLGWGLRRRSERQLALLGGGGR